MQTKALYFVLLLGYFAFSSVLLYVSGANLLLATLVFWFVPSLFFVRRVHLSLAFLCKVTIFSLSSTLAWEVFAYLNQIWFEHTIFSVRVLGLFPIEILFWNLGYVLFIVLTYEFFFDNFNINGKIQPRYRFPLSLFHVGLVFIPLVYLIIFSHITFDFMYALLVVATLVTLTIGLLVRHANLSRVFKKGFAQSLFMLPPSLMHEAVSISNQHWYFYESGSYLLNINFFGYPLPIEEFLFILLIPFWVIVMYEMYLDDAR